MNEIFTTDYKTILQKIEQVNPVQYGKTRNYIDGAVTYLSPYISRGVISTKQVLNSMFEKGYKIQQIETFVKELCWRDYFQRVGQHKNLNKDIRQQQQSVLNNEMPVQILNATTGIEGIDNAIQQLYYTGYMHNHCRMYTASLVCNIAKSHWHHPAQWMYYHLLDGDWASNSCSWQWVAAANSNKKYFANQENINKFTNTNQTNTYLDKSYEVLETMQTPAPLLNTQIFVPEINLPESSAINIDATLPAFIYNYYNLDPLWHKEKQGNRILLIEPDFFSQYPVSKKCMDFMLALSKNIPGIQVYTGSFQSFTEIYKSETIYYKEHPLNIGYKGNEEPRAWITAEVTEYYPSFFGYWKKVERQLYKLK
jgi:deoxyribodipyrimidine photo-lyase